MMTGGIIQSHMIRTLTANFHDEPDREEAFIGKIITGEIDQIIWSGNEPLDWNLHWQTMQFLIDSGFAKNIFVQYSTMLPRVEWKKRNLFEDILPHFKGSHINATIMTIQEGSDYIFQTISWDKWRNHLNLAIENACKRNNHSISLDVALTLPGLLAIEDIVSFLDQLGLPFQSRIFESSGPECILTPLVLPRELLNEVIDNTVKSLFAKATITNLRIIQTLLNIRKSSVHEEAYPSLWKQQLRTGKAKLETSESTKNHQLYFIDLLSKHPKVLQWWLEQ